MRNFSISPICFIALWILPISSLYAQSPDSLVRSTLDPAENRAHMLFMASDEMGGRGTGTPELKLAARYIAEQLRRYGASPAGSGAHPWFQPVKLREVTPASVTSLSFTSGIDTDSRGTALFRGGNTMVTAPLAWDGGNMPDGDLSGKAVLLSGGGTDGGGPVQGGRGWLRMSAAKYEQAVERGAEAVIELYSHPGVRWESVKGLLERSRMELAGESGGDKSDAPAVPHLLLFDPDSSMTDGLVGGETVRANIETAGRSVREITSYNVAGIVEGTDPELREQVVMLTAHYDHLGTDSDAPAGQDAIYNGARDNGIGIVALLSAAQNLAKHPPKRSVAFLFVTAEEKGLLGSRWYTERPLIPLERTVFVANIDGAGYTDTTLATVPGLERTTAGEHFKAASRAFGLEAVPSPDPRLRLFFRSDNIVFSRLGIPSTSYSQGFTDFGPDLQRYYHRPGDEAQNLNYSYLNRYYGAFTTAVRLIADDPEHPRWVPGQPFIEQAEKLYGTGKE